MSKTTRTSKGKRPKESKIQDGKEKENLWKYCEKLPTLMEADKLCKSDMAKLCCREKYYIKPVKYESEGDHNNEICQMFGTMIGQDYKFMRQ